MRLIALRLVNFRQFYGATPAIRFSSGERNVTILHGCNGAGKTALLNAFTWVLYGSFSRGFQLRDQLVNKRAIREAKNGDLIEAKVVLEFEHNDRRYEISRSAAVKKTNGDPGWTNIDNAPAVLRWCAEDGKWRQEDRVEDAIGRILPIDLHTYFFFDGERIERIVQPTKAEKADIANATKKFLGIEILERAERHLKAARKDLERELAQIGDPETVRVLEEKTRAEASLEIVRDRNAEIARNIDGHKAAKAELEKRLRELEGVSGYQRRRDQLNKATVSREEQLKRSRQQLADEVSTNGYGVFLGQLSETFEKMIDTLRSRGELPTGIKRQFVADLLDKAQCICGRPLDEHSDSRGAVEKWMERAGLADVEETAIRMGGEVAKLKHIAPTLWQRLDQIQTQRIEDRKELARIEAELQDIGDKLKNSPQEEVAGLQRRLEEVDRAIEDAHREMGGNDTKIKALTQQIERLQLDIKRHETAEAQQQLAQQRVTAAEDAADRIAQVRELLEKDFRSQLGERIRKLFVSISYTPYIPEIAADYSIRLIEAAGGNPLPVAASQGENQILSLAFIGSIIDQAREYQARKDRLPGPDSSSFPVVMDSPFGSLDQVYRQQIAEHIPRLADQVVIMVTPTQWRGEVEKASRPRVGRHYVMTYYSPRNDIQSDSLTLDGKGYELFKASPNDYEYTEIREVENG